MKKIILFIFILASGIVHASDKIIVKDAPSVFDPVTTYVFMAGVLKWQSPSLSPFSSKNRKDEELYNLLLSKGVNKANTVFLKDGEATLDNMSKKMKELLAKTTAGSTLIFYYAGHGVRAGNNPVCFANYDYNSSSGNGFKASSVSEQINSLFKGKQVLLLADCCFSGALIDEGKKISSSGKSVTAFTSSTSSNISTANWTFTQTIIDCLSGVAVCDRNTDGKITLGEVRTELYDAMRYRERQLGGAAFFNTDESVAFNLGKVQSTAKPSKVEYIYIFQNNKFEPARVMAYNGNNVTGELFRYSDKVSVTVPVSKTKTIAFADYPIGKQVQVEWNGKNYPAVIKEAKNGFHYIHYSGYDNSWDEWVTYDRIYTPERKKCSVEWGGQWYPGEMLQQKSGKYLVHYTGYGDDWDEWVGAERIKL